MLPLSLYGGVEVGLDEAGRGPLAGSVFAGAVLLPPDFCDERLNDSKKMTERDRLAVREVIKREAVAWGVGEVTAAEIDEINILNASFRAMRRAYAQLVERLPQGMTVERLLVDGNRFRPGTLVVPYECIVKGDGKLAPIAAASVLAKTCRDDYMLRLHEEYPRYGWDRNKGYPTAEHREAIARYGLTPYHRVTFCRRFLPADEVL
ncbi:MAG TPA: ribonuclease HII [Candidatus Rikenella faecigallinarum]|uniref:Ribonuclease HII n=1 Tax=Candidatus Rikenella faecigallinarum TaxID=2838745 RepID=A0A9D1QG17_9BACT|nr:ribonuclease HII [Candidatus Rikenella faecigallinarum]